MNPASHALPWSVLAGFIFSVCMAVRVLAGPAQAAKTGPPNLAPQASIRANSEHSADYRARFVADGRVPEQESRQDLGQAWCVQGNTHRQSAEISFNWTQAVTVAEVVYYGRTAWFLEECWKDYELFINNSTEPILRGALQKQSGPQRLRLAQPVQAHALRLAFRSSYGGLNPGASEIQIFGRPLSEPEVQRLAQGAAAVFDKASLEDLLRLIDRLSDEHGRSFTARIEARLRRQRLQEASARGDDISEALAELQRQVLLFDVDRMLALQRHEIDASHVYTYHNEGFRPGGGLYLVPLRGSEMKPVELVASPQGQILDCDLSYDGRTVLFSWRQREDEGYHLWRINIDGSGLHPLTQGRWHDYNGCWLPDGGIAFVSTRHAQFAYCWNSPVGVVHRLDADGAKVRRLSANYLNDFTPYPLHDGRLIYSRWEYVDKPAIPIQSLWTINPDGTSLSGYFGNRVISPGTFMEARPIPGSTKILCTMTGHNGPARGAIGVIDRSQGPNAQEAIWNVTPDVPVPAVAAGNGNFEGTKLYSSPYPLDATRFLVSARGPVLVRNLEGTAQSVALPKPGKGLAWFSAQPVRARARPRVIPSILETNIVSYAVNEPAAETCPGQPASGSGTATLYLQDIYRGLEGFVRPGEIKRLRVVRELPKTVRIHPDKRAFGFQFPVISAGATYAGKDVLGEVEVNADGSAHFEVPAGIPIYFMALDAQGRAVQRMRSFTHLMPGEVQGCVGCHHTRDPGTPLPASALAFIRPPQKLTPPEWGRGGFDYAAVVQPALDRHCIRCHHGANPAGKVDLSGDLTDFFNVSYETLARGRRQWGEAQWDSPYVSWIPSYNGFETNILVVAPKSWGSPRSRLTDLLLNDHVDADGKPRTAIDEASRRRILAWIDLNVPYYGSSETTHPDNPGSRRIYPADLDKVLADVAARRCGDCHPGGKIPRLFWTRISNPHLNNFLLAPLAREAGGTEACGKAVFERTSDPDYQSILKTFDPVLAALREHPRLDMPGARPVQTVNRSCQ